MTLIAALDVDKNPVLVSDLLLFSEFKSKERKIHIPTLGEISNNMVIRDNICIKEIIQKTYIFGDNLAVSWSGRDVEAEAFLKELKIYLEKGICSKKSIEQFVNYSWDFQKLSIIILGFDSKLNEHFLLQKGNGGDLYTADTDYFGRFVVDGSGFEMLNISSITEYTKMNLENFYANNLNDITNNLDLIKNLTKILQFCSFIMHEEIRGAYFMNYFFGGGFEITYLTKNGVKKLDSVLYMFAEIIENNGNPYLHFKSESIKSDYINGTLVFTRINTTKRITKNGEALFVEKGEKECIVHPLIGKKNISKSILKNIDLNAKVLVLNIVTSPDIEEQVSTMGSVFFANNEGLPVKFKNGYYRDKSSYVLRPQVFMEWEKDFIDSIVNKASRHCK